MQKDEKFNIFNQAGLLITTALAVAFLSQGFMVGNIIGFFAQGFWFYTSVKNKQWGIFALSIFYTVMYTIGSVRWLLDL